MASPACGALPGGMSLGFYTCSDRSKSRRGSCIPREVKKTYKACVAVGFVKRAAAGSAGSQSPPQRRRGTEKPSDLCASVTLWWVLISNEMLISNPDAERGFAAGNRVVEGV